MSRFAGVTGQSENAREFARKLWLENVVILRLDQGVSRAHVACGLSEVAHDELGRAKVEGHAREKPQQPALSRLVDGLLEDATGVLDATGLCVQRPECSE